MGQGLNFGKIFLVNSSARNNDVYNYVGKYCFQYTQVLEKVIVCLARVHFFSSTTAASAFLQYTLVRYEMRRSYGGNGKSIIDSRVFICAVNMLIVILSVMAELRLDVRVYITDASDAYMRLRWYKAGEKVRI